MTGYLDPSALRPEDRLAEIAAILVRGYNRSRAGGAEPFRDSREDPGGPALGGAMPREERPNADEGSGDRFRRDRNELAVLDDTAHSCDHAVNSREKGKVA